MVFPLSTRFYSANSRRLYSAIGRSRTETIYALASGAQAAAINVIRVSGDRVGEVMQRMAPDVKDLIPNRMYRTILVDEVDEAMMVYFKGPRSFTGEDVLEIHSHGSSAIRKAIFTRLSQIAGVRPAEPGEFSQRAFLNGKMDLMEAEALKDLIDSTSEVQRTQAFKAYRGRTSRHLHEWRQQLIQALAILEAWIDFGEDEQIEAGALLQVKEILSQMRTTMKHRLDHDRHAEIIREGLKVTICGLPNAGKSSLLNGLLGHKAAIVSPIPGTTRDPIEKSFELAGMLIHLTDTAGIRPTDDSIEAEGVEMAMDRLHDAHLVLLVIDAPAYLTGVREFPPVIDPAKTIVLFNKIDLLKEIPSEWHLPAELASCPIWPVSLFQHSRPDLLLKLQQMVVERYAKLLSDPPILTHTRHQTSIQNALTALDQCAHLLEADELVGAAEYLRRAAMEVGRVTGHIGADEVLDVLFSSFCIGK